jgi:hypothetical protein
VRRVARNHFNKSARRPLRSRRRADQDTRIGGYDREGEWRA